MNKIFEYYATVNKQILTPQKEKELFSLYKKGNKKQRDYALDQLIKNNYRLILKIYNKSFKRYKGLKEDLLMCGFDGVIAGLESFDYNKGANKLSTYISYRILQKMSDYIRKNGNIVRIPSHLLEASNKINRYLSSKQLSLDFININDSKLIDDIYFNVLDQKITKPVIKKLFYQSNSQKYTPYIDDFKNEYQKTGSYGDSYFDISDNHRQIFSILNETLHNPKQSCIVYYRIVAGYNIKKTADQCKVSNLESQRSYKEAINYLKTNEDFVDILKDLISIS